MWAVLAPDYTMRAITNHAQAVADLTDAFRELDDQMEPTVHAMWQMHHTLIELSENLVYALIYNSFADFYRRLARHYYRDLHQRADAHEFWRALHEAARLGEASQGAALVQAQILNTYEYWRAAAGGEWPMADS
jgi:DNA-binding FadR family transcriptional regulator